MGADIFGMAESSSFARALAANEGVRVKEMIGQNVTPYSTDKGEIIIGSPSIYGHDTYMGHLHREISKQSKDMKFFNELDVSKNPLQHLCKCILQSQRTEYHLHGVYEGRDRILDDAYTENMKKGGGVQKVVNKLAKENPTAAAMIYIGNEMRNNWQGYHYCEPPPAIQSEVDRLRPMLQEEWLKLDSRESLETLLKRIQFEELQQQQQEGEGEGEGDGEGGSGKDKGSGEGKGDGQADSDGTGGDGEGSGEVQPDSGEGEQGSEGQQQGDAGDDSGSKGDSNESGDQDGSSADSQQSPQGEGKGTQQDSKGSNDGKPEQVSGTAHNHHGATDAYSSLKDIGLIKEPIKEGTKEAQAQQNSAPYRPQGNDLSETDITKYDSNHYRTGYTKEIERLLQGFSLSRKVRKYLISQSQVGYELGKKRGKICSKNIGRIYAGHTQPRVFKEKCATKIQTDTAVFILGDCSGSMSNMRYTTSSCCQIAMSEVLQTLHIPHMMMQFSTASRGRAHYIMKKFGEQYVSRDKLVERYGSEHIYMGCNADGEAVTAAAQYLAQRKEKNKLLIVLSDGAPAYGDGNDDQFLKDTVKIIEDSKLMNIVGIGIQTTDVRRYYKNSKVVNQLDELESVLLGLLKSEVLK